MEIKRCYDTVIGASVGENQLINTSANTSTIHGVTFTNNGDGSWTANGENDGTTSTKEIATYNHIGGHKYAITGVPNQSSSSTYRMFIDYVGSIYSDKVFTYNTTATLPVKISIISGYTANNVKFVPQLIDLTTAFGSTIADYIYSLETATAGSGIAKLREWGFLRGYQAYNAGSIESVEVTGKVVRGFNQWDEEWEVGGIRTADGTTVSSNAVRSTNYNAMIGGATYYTKSPSDMGVYVFFYGADYGYISYAQTLNNAFVVPLNAKYFKIQVTGAYGTTYNNDICINLSSSHNGEYEPYTEQTYDYGDDTLNGIFKLDANNNLYAHGDVKTSDGVITRKYGVVDLGTLNYTKQAASGSALDRYNTTDLASVVSRSGGVAMLDLVCAKFVASSDVVYDRLINNAMCVLASTGTLYITASGYADASAFKQAMSGTYLVYRLQTPTTEQGDPFPSPQICYPDGTEEYTTSNGVPVGHETRYEL